MMMKLVPEYQSLVEAGNSPFFALSKDGSSSKTEKKQDFSEKDSGAPTSLEGVSCQEPQPCNDVGIERSEES